MDFPLSVSMTSFTLWQVVPQCYSKDSEFCGTLMWQTEMSAAASIKLNMNKLRSLI